ncbi:hypothetical protein ACF3NT_12845 [Naumannella halotolerans]|uniref:hypothetical protein n=1 Tax=Naumannella halotolerans TaxID=993414 RepID=UPI00370D16A0
MREHPTTDELAELALGEAAAPVADHVAGCADCQAELAALAEVSSLLEGEDPPPIPEAVAARLQATLAEEVEREQQGQAFEDQREALLRASKRTELGTFGPNLATEKKDFSPDGRHAVAARNRARRQG